MRVWAIILVIATTIAWQAQAADGPLLKVTFEEDQAIPGQPLSYRLSILVPTWLPKPAVFPSLEIPNVLVRLPEGSTGPISETVDGETWSGVTRHYRLSPMVPGPFNIPPQDVIVTYADPEDSSPVTVTLKTEPIAFSGVLPEGAEGVEPFVAAKSIVLKQEVSGPTEGLKPGDSVSRRVTAEIAGTSPMFLPPLLPELAIDGIAAYADEPIVTEKEERGDVSGRREESVTLVAEGGGEGAAAPIELRWYNLDTKSVETASVDGFAVSVDGPPASAPIETIDRRALVMLSLAVVALAIVLILALRYAVPRVRRRRAARKAAWLASEDWAYRRLTAAIAHRDYGETVSALDLWESRKIDPRRDPAVHAALVKLGAARFGRDPTAAAAETWRELTNALRAARHAARHSVSETQTLPPMNPHSAR